MPGNRTDYGTEQTDRAVKRVERRLSSVYRQAQRDIDDKLKDWQERHKKRDARYRQMVAAGKMSKEDYRAWLRGQVFQEKQWQARRDEIDNILLNADRAAQNIVNEGKLGVFAANANYMGYALERDSNIDTGFVLYSEGTVARLIEDDPQILPKPAPGVQKDLAFPYYNKLMSSAITQGIVQGETISEIAGRVARTTGESSYKSAMRNARTAYTGAQNAGRIEGLHQAQRLGIKVKKKWLAILDSRTRDTHRDLDGQIQEVDDPFVVDGDEFKFPGDPTAKPALTYNCRCTLTYEYPDYPSTMPRRDAETGQIVADMTYREWEALKKGEGKVTEPETNSKPETGSKTDDELERFGSALQGASNAAEFWMNMDADQMDAFNASGENIYDFYNRLHDKASPETLEMPEWKPDAPGGKENYRIFHDFSGDTIDVTVIPPKSEGWMADAETTGLIRVREGGFDEWRYIIGHEAGHQLSNIVPELGTTIIENPGSLLGRYNQKRALFDGAFGEYNAEEAWADAVSAYINTPQQFQTQYPELYDAVNGFFESSPSARDYIDRAYAAYRKAVGL